MASHSARIGLIAGIVALAGALIGGLVLVELLVDAAFRTPAIRLVAAAVFAIAALRIRTLVHRDLAQQPASTLDFGAGRSMRAGGERSRFDQLYDELRFGARNQRYFDAVLWPHLVSLAEAAAGTPADWLTKPPGRSFGRGPSVASLTAAIASIEARR
ncbi:MAG: hypothetical protein HYU41_12800 [Candidatus Rokubacteria bacterium]|nr:hypothetical protein [Candidatus Rokubacteria bacterium]